jgi:hypothetical protein
LSRIPAVGRPARRAPTPRCLRQVFPPRAPPSPQGEQEPWAFHPRNQGPSVLRVFARSPRLEGQGQPPRAHRHPVGIAPTPRCRITHRDPRHRSLQAAHGGPLLSRGVRPQIAAGTETLTGCDLRTTRRG